MTQRTGFPIQTYSGIFFYPLDPRVEEVRIVDIAHALSQQTRFTGHLKKFYSIAEHSVHVSYLCKPENALNGLMHDATEAYLCDVATPVKRDPRFSFYTEAEDALAEVIIDAFGLTRPLMPEDVRWADKLMVGAEALTLMLHPPIDDWHLKYGKNDEFPVDIIRAYQPRDAATRFMMRFNELTSKQAAKAA
jgi:uncharacterized protein